MSVLLFHVIINPVDPVSMQAASVLRFCQEFLSIRRREGKMGEDWKREEVEATVADYLDMLSKELRGLKYAKTAHRHRLAEMLNMRSDGAIERKHQNISAVLIELGFPYVSGYKPLRNYQQLLYDVVSSRLEINQTLVDTVRFQVQQPAPIPVVADILATLVAPPAADPWHITVLAAGYEKAPKYRMTLITSPRKLGTVHLEQQESNLLFASRRPASSMQGARAWPQESSTCRRHKAIVLASMCFRST